MGVMHIPGHQHQGPREVSLEEVRAVLGDCRLCELAQTRTNIVFGVGNPHARVMFVGEAPGRNEDLQGEPFVGRAGENLNGILSLAGPTKGSPCCSAAQPQMAGAARGGLSHAGRLPGPPSAGHGARSCPGAGAGCGRAGGDRGGAASGADRPPAAGG